VRSIPVTIKNTKSIKKWNSMMKEKNIPVTFVGAGPGDPELITVKGRRCIREADLVLYAGSLVPKALVSDVKAGARVVDSSALNLDETHRLMRDTVHAGGKVARVHTGDPSLYGAVREQMALLDRDGIPYRVIPGVTAAFAAAASAGVSFTLPEKTQTLMLTRMEGRTPVPESEKLRNLARHGASLAVYLSSGDPEGLRRELLEGGYPEDTSVVIGYRVGWPEELILKTDLAGLVDMVKETGINRQAVFLILPGQGDEPVFSRLYDPEFSHGYRKGNNT
jgi:precorrin-4/cobalt-precorrin-4 C11-methyltransferase